MDEHYQGHRKRLKDKFDRSPSVFADYELVELLLTYVIPRRDVKPLAKNILEEAGSMMNLLTDEMDNVKGIGKETLLFFRALREFFKRAEMSRVKQKEVMLTPEDIYKYLRYYIALSSTEKLAALFLDPKNGIINHQMLSEGIVNSAVIFPRQVVELAIKYKASGVVLAHNHPTGDPTPSDTDIVMTRKIKEALETIDIQLIDHVIVCKTGFASLASLGVI